MESLNKEYNDNTQQPVVSQTSINSSPVKMASKSSIDPVVSQTSIQPAKEVTAFAGNFAAAPRPRTASQPAVQPQQPVVQQRQPIVQQPIAQQPVVQRPVAQQPVAQQQQPVVAQTSINPGNQATAAAPRPRVASQQPTDPAARPQSAAIAPNAARVVAPRPQTAKVPASNDAGAAFKSKFCYECGFKFQTTVEKFCCDCGTKRM
jgi:hypothetical protein